VQVLSGAFRQCETVKADGNRCRARALPNRPHCAFHDETTREAQSAGRRAGGRKRSRPAATFAADTADAGLSTVAEATKFLGRVANATAKGLLDPRVTNAVVYTVATLVNALAKSDLEERIKRIEEQLAQRKNRT
jgi:hypothetical protein